MLGVLRAHLNTVLKEWSLLGDMLTVSYCSTEEVAIGNLGWSLKNMWKKETRNLTQMMAWCLHPGLPGNRSQAFF